MKKSRHYLGFFALLITLPQTTHPLSAPSPKAIFNKLKPGLDSTRSLDVTVSALHTVAEKWPSNTFETNKNYYQILPNCLPDTLKEKMEKTVNTGDIAKTFVQQTTTLSNEEQTFIDARLQHIARYFHATKKFSNKEILNTINPSNLNTVPRIAVCASGGGFRAMIATMGFWDGMKHAGLDNLIVMTSCLSGSTWFTMPWCIGKEISQLQAGYEKYALVPLDPSVYNKLKNNPLVLPQATTYPTNQNCLFAERNIINDKFAQAFYWRFPYNMVQPYGNLIGHMTLSAFDDPEIIKAGLSEEAQEETDYYIDNLKMAPYTGPSAIQSRQTVYLSQAGDFLKSPDGIASRPLPLATSITQYDGTWWSTAQTVSDQQKSFDGYGWITYTPFNVEMDFYDRNGIRSGARIETQYLGRRFDNVRTHPKRWYRLTNPETIGYGAVNRAPEYTLDYLMGIWGSAFGISINFILNGSGLEDAVDPAHVDIDAQDNTNNSVIMKHTKQALGGALKLANKGFGALTAYGDFRLLPAVINNFAVFPDSPFVDHTTLVTVDAGIAFNLPFPPLLKPERNIDMIIALDASADVSDGQLSAIAGAERWAKKHGIPFPIIETSSLYKNASTRPFTVFDQFDDSVPADKRFPIIFYIPLIDNTYACATHDEPFSLTGCLKAACSTFNFSYTPEDVQSLSNHMSCAVQNMKSKIMATVEQTIRKMNNMPLLPADTLQYAAPFTKKTPVATA